MTNNTNHAIKVNRAVKLSAIGSNPRSCAAMLNAILLEVIDALPARAIAKLLDANWQMACASKALAIREAIQDGAVWDGSKHREIAA